MQSRSELMPGESLTLWTIRLSFACFVLAAGCWLSAGDGRPRRLANLIWSLGCATYWLHAFAAYHFIHQWNHWAAIEHVEHQSAELIGIPVGIGIYFNWLFGVVWTFDAFLAWRTTDSEESMRLTRTRIALLGFMVFMWINGAIVFADGAIRWFAILSFAALGTLFIRRVRRSRSQTKET